MLTRRSWFVSVALLAVWLLLIAWQVAEHLSFQRAARTTLVSRARNTSSTLARMVRSLAFFGIIDTNRLESSLSEIVKPGEFNPTSLLLLNADNELVGAAGAPIDPGIQEKLVDGEFPGNVYWDDKAQTLAILNVVDLGTNIVGFPEELRRPRNTTSAGATNSTTNLVDTGTNLVLPQLTNTVPQPENNLTVASNIPAASTNETNRPPPGGRRGGGRRGGRGDPNQPFRKTEGMSQQVYEEIIHRRGVHGLLVVIPSEEVLSAISKDLWMRVFIGILGTIAVAGYGLAWGNLKKTSELQIRLVRASELNSHLKEMNLAAAGLAHETRNPLNIVRGLAQMISRREDASPEIKTRTREIIDETDRVTAQLNEFINYSRPREVRRAPTNLNAVIAEVVRALNYDVDEKKVQLNVQAEPLTIQADEQLLRQALFNLVLNAIQAIPANGQIQIRAGRRNGNGAYVEVADNGPGVAPEHRSELFKPYFTTHAEGTGLGLAVVQQIVLAHGWEIACLPNQPNGALFRITHIRTAH